MPITITVEDGTIVTGANSYASVAVVSAYALNRGVVLTPGTDVIEAKLIKSMDYFIQFRNRWKGVRVSALQNLDWPRRYVYLYDTDEDFFPYIAMPTELVEAQCQLVMALEAGIGLNANFDPRAFLGNLPVIKDKIGPIETTYADPFSLPGVDWVNISLPTVDALLGLLLREQGLHLSTVRV